MRQIIFSPSYHFKGLLPKNWWRSCWLVAFFLTGCGKLPNEAPEFKDSESRPGGALTVKRLHTRSFVYPREGLSKKQQLNFWTGFSLFRDPWVIAPSSTKDRDGLGPLFNTRSCITCHHAGARGPMPPTGISYPSALVLRLGSTKKASPSLVDNNYGGQIQPRAIGSSHTKTIRPQHSKEGLMPEAALDLHYEILKGQFEDGETYQLRKPHYELVRLAYGELDKDIAVSPRFAPNVFGMGLLDSIATDDLLQQEDPDDTNQDGISGRYNRVPNLESKQIEVGRFGLKAKHPNLRQQVAAAFRDDIGITNPLFPEESCTPLQHRCSELANQGEHMGVEIPDKLLKLVVEFSRYIGVPPARNTNTEPFIKGRSHFYKIGCHLCHTPSYQINGNQWGDSEQKKSHFSKENSVEIWPYTDLALHDMGEELADEVYEYDANGREWRTPPLWGLGLMYKVTGEAFYLHDGRARSLQEAILWHGGEAEASKRKFKQLTKSERTDLLQFLQSI